jgi:hypothetical protein
MRRYGSWATPAQAQSVAPSCAQLSRWGHGFEPRWGCIAKPQVGDVSCRVGCAPLLGRRPGSGAAGGPRARDPQDRTHRALPPLMVGSPSTTASAGRPTSSSCRGALLPAPPGNARPDAVWPRSKPVSPVGHPMVGHRGCPVGIARSRPRIFSGVMVSIGPAPQPPTPRGSDDSGRSDRRRVSRGDRRRRGTE